MPKCGELSSAAFGILAIAAAASAQTPLGAEFRVDLQGGTPFQFFTQRSVSMARDGRFIVAWTRGVSDPQIVARWFGAAGNPIGAEFLVNSYTTGNQYNPTVASDDAGNFVVVWISENQDGSANGVFGQRFDASGTRLGGEFQVNQTTGDNQWRQSVAMRPGGEFVVVWTNVTDIFARRYDASGAPIGGEFQVDASTAMASDGTVGFDGAGNFVVVWGAGDPQLHVRGRLFTAAGAPQGAEFVLSGSGAYFDPRVARNADGSFIVVWWGSTPGDTDFGIAAQRFDANATPIGGIFRVNELTTGRQQRPSVVVDGDGDFVVVWENADQTGVSARRFDSAGAGRPEFRVSTYTLRAQWFASLATDPAGNFVVVWHSRAPDHVVGRRYAGGLTGLSLSVDAAAGPTSDGNGVLEAGETVVIAPSWLNGDFAPHAFSGAVSGFTGPGIGGNPTYAITDGAAAYGTVASGATASCTSGADCYALGISMPSARPVMHWDAAFHEQLVPGTLAEEKVWPLHIGDSFTDVPRSNGYYRFVETLLHRGVTAGCTPTTYCPVASTTREQMAVFVLVSKEGTGYAPPACFTLTFLDVPVSSPYCPWIQELSLRGVVGGCGGPNFCPTAPVSRQEMAVFALATKEPGVVPPACGPTPVFNDVPASSPFCRWIEELARRGVVSGCGGGAYCPEAPVTRDQMGVFLSLTFGLLLYGP